MESHYTFKSNPNLNDYIVEPYYSWIVNLYDIMGDQSFTVRDMMYSLGVNGDEAMSLLTYAFFDLKCLKLG
jgi:hypothetical protein